MTPRLSSSKTWTQFPDEFLEQVQDLVAETFEEHLVDGASLRLEGRIYPEEILFRLGIKTEGQLRQNNFEVSAQYNPASQNVKKVMHHCIEAAASMMAEYFDWYHQPGVDDPENKSNDIDFPRDWTEYHFEGVPLFMKYSTVNTDLEAEADRLLGTQSSQLVEGTLDSEDALDFIVEERIKPTPEDGEIDPDSENFDEDDLNYESDRVH